MWKLNKERDDSRVGPLRKGQEIPPTQNECTRVTISDVNITDNGNTIQSLFNPPNSLAIPLPHDGLMLAAGEYTDAQTGYQAEPIEPESATPRVLAIISSVIEKLVARNDGLVEALREQLDGLSLSRRSSSGRLGKGLNAFHGVRAPSISIPKYLERIYKYTNCSPSCFVVGYVYIDRLAHRHPDSLLISLNVHRLLVTSVLVASKLLDDVHYNNAFYARVGGVSNAELNRLELELLFLLDFGVMVSSRVFESYCLHLEKEMLLNGTAGRKIERAIVPITVDELTEISVEDTQNSSSVDLVED